MAVVFVTGATGLVGGGVVRQLIEDDIATRVFVLVRGHAAWRHCAARLGASAARVVPVVGDVTAPGLGLDATTHAQLARAISAVVHCAGDTTFSRPLADARAVNTAGTHNLLDIVTAWRIERLVHVSTAFVAGRRTGSIPETALDDTCGFVNGYEQSKHEAETLVRRSGLPYVIVRPSTIICDDTGGVASQINAAHRALRIFHSGLAALMPGAPDTPVDMVTNEHVVDGVIRIGLSRAGLGGTFHLCAGAGAMPLCELLDRAHAVWSRDPQWRRRGITMPALTDLDTYRLFEQSVEETGDLRLAAITRSLSHFVPQLAMPKQFQTCSAESILDCAAPPVADYWDRVVENLLAARWGVGAQVGSAA